MQALATTQADASAIEQVLVGGDLARLTTTQRLTYYSRLCESLGLNPLSKPFEYLTLNGKTVLYARRDCTDQLRKIHRVSVRVVSRETTADLLIVTTQATTPDGRIDESIGAVPVAGLKGEALANALMKADTKAKRRVTLSICGLGMLDEAELDGVRDQVLPQINPHDQEGDSSGGAPDAYELLRGELASVDISVEVCDSYDKLLALRAVVGTKGDKPTAWQSQYRDNYERFNGEQRKELGRLWQRCDRQLAKLELKLKPDVTASFIDPDPAEDFPRE